MNALKLRISEQPFKTMICGLRDATSNEISDIKHWLTDKGVPFKHKTMYETRNLPLPYNGLLIINPKKKKKLRTG